MHLKGMTYIFIAVVKIALLYKKKVKLVPKCVLVLGPYRKLECEIPFYSKLTFILRKIENNKFYEWHFWLLLWGPVCLACLGCVILYQAVRWRCVRVYFVLDNSLVGSVASGIRLKQSNETVIWACFRWRCQKNKSIPLVLIIVNITKWSLPNVLK